MPKLKNIPINERPRERLLANGTANLTDEELLAILLGKGTAKCDVLSLAKKMIPVIDEKESDLSIDDLTAFDGIGLVNKSHVHPREVFADVIAERASAVIIAHNHPASSISPSKEDYAITDSIKEAGKILGINLLDHIIFNRTDYYSFAEHNKL